MHINDRVEITSGAIWVRQCLDIREQKSLLALCAELSVRPAGLYRPTVRGGGQMHVKMMCLGLHWNALTYRYENVRSDYDGLPVEPLPQNLRALAARIAAGVEMPFDPELCIINFYEDDGRMGLHQDKDESPESLRAELPIVSISLGDTGRFLFGGLRRRDPTTVVPLASGDAFVFGGSSRLRYHGVSGIENGTAPEELAFAGRFNLTFRQYGIKPASSSP